MSDPVVICAYDPAWPHKFRRLAARAVRALQPLATEIHHVGSTSVPGLAAKPVSDLVVEPGRHADVAEAIIRLGQIGYVPEGDRGIRGREAFRWPDGERRHHLYATAAGGEELRRQLALRDHLRAHPDVRDRHGALKRGLAGRFGADRDGYTAAKTDSSPPFWPSPPAVRTGMRRDLWRYLRPVVQSWPIGAPPEDALFCANHG